MSGMYGNQWASSSSDREDRPFGISVLEYADWASVNATEALEAQRGIIVSVDMENDSLSLEYGYAFTPELVWPMYLLSVSLASLKTLPAPLWRHSIETDIKNVISIGEHVLTSKLDRGEGVL